MVGNNLLRYLRRINQAVTMRTSTTSSKETSVVEIDSTLLFQRLIKIAENNSDYYESAFVFELYRVHSSLFDTIGLPRKAN